MKEAGKTYKYLILLLFLFYWQFSNYLSFSAIAWCFQYKVYEPTAVILENIRQVVLWCWLTLPIKRITDVLKLLTENIISFTANTFGLTVIYILIIVSTFKMSVNLYVLHNKFSMICKRQRRCGNLKCYFML